MFTYLIKDILLISKLFELNSVLVNDLQQVIKYIKPRLQSGYNKF